MLQLGRKPSIDAVRIKLGNTGSKTTIARYFKGLQQTAPSVSLSPQERLRAQLLALVNQVGRRVGPGGRKGTGAREQFDQEYPVLRTALSRQSNELEPRKIQVSELSDKLSQAQIQKESHRAQLSSEQQLMATRPAKVQELHTQLAKKQSQLQTLYETSVHARESLLHFRDASNEQNAPPTAPRGTACSAGRAAA